MSQGRRLLLFGIQVARRQHEGYLSMLNVASLAACLLCLLSICSLANNHLIIKTTDIWRLLARIKIQPCFLPARHNMNSAVASFGPNQALW